MSRIEIIGQIWASLANGQVYSRLGIAPTLCCGAHNGVQPKINEIMETNGKSKLNRYVRFIYNKMKRLHGVQKVREEALAIYVLTTKEKARVFSANASTFSPEFVEGYINLLRGWNLPTRFVNESLAMFGTTEDLIQVLKDLTPLRVRIRKLTPKECMRLQAVSDEDYEKMRATGLSNSALYKLAGNSICLAPMEGIFKQLFREDSDCLF